MRHEVQVDVLARLLAVRTTGEPEPWCREATVAAADYASPARLDDEIRDLFRPLPIIVGRESDVAKEGDYFTHDATGMPILVTRGRDGRVHAMLNVCRHRGTRLVDEGHGTAKAFVCRYHAWTYDLTGKLGHVPSSACFPSLDKGESGLVELPVECRHGFVWVVPTPGMNIDVRSWLGAFDDDFAAFALAGHASFRRTATVRAANWKLVVDAFLEGYHVKSLHRETLSRFFEDGVVVDTTPWHVRSVGARRSLGELTSTPREQWDVRGSATVFYLVFPSTVLVFHPEAVSHISLFPRGVGSVSFEHTMLVAREPASAEEHGRHEKTFALIDGRVFAHEDLAIAESIQSVLHAGANESFRLGRLEYPIRFFHDAIDRAIGERGG